LQRFLLSQVIENASNIIGKLAHMYEPTTKDIRFAEKFFLLKGLSVHDAEDLASSSVTKACLNWGKKSSFKTFLYKTCQIDLLSFNKEQKRLKVKVINFTDAKIIAGHILDDQMSQYDFEYVTPWRSVLAMVYGSGDWTPKKEGWVIGGDGVVHPRKSPSACDVCGGKSGPIQPGISLCCGACHRSGLDAKLKADLKETLKRRKSMRVAKSLIQRKLNLKKTTPPPSA